MATRRISITVELADGTVIDATRELPEEGETIELTNLAGDVVTTSGPEDADLTQAIAFEYLSARLALAVRGAR